MPVNILIAEDHAIMRQGLMVLLEEQPDFRIAGQAQDGREAVELARELKPDIVIMDIDMPEKNGILATKEICSENPDCRVIGLSMLTTSQFITGMFEVGARGYVPKDSAFEELSAAIDSVLKGQMYLSPAVSKTVLTDYVSRIRSDKSSQDSILSDREKQVLQLIAEGKASKEIAPRLHVSLNTVIRHRQNIMDKLELHSVAELTRYAIREGLIRA